MMTDSVFVRKEKVEAVFSLIYSLKYYLSFTLCLRDAFMAMLYQM